MWIADSRSALFPDWIQVVRNDTRAVHGFSVFREGKRDVWITPTMLASTTVLLTQANSTVDADPHDAKSLCIFRNIVALKNSAHIKSQGLGRDIHARCCFDRIVDEVRDQREVENIDTFLHHRDT